MKRSPPGGGFEDTDAPARTDPTVGSIATVIGTFAWGPRPNQPDNVNFADEYDVMDDPDERARRRQSWIDRGYGRICCGPIFCPAYHDGQRPWAPDTDWISGDINIFYARMDELLTAGFKLDYHAIPDAGRFVRHDGGPALDVCERELGPIYRSIAFQTRFSHGTINIGWEPAWCSADWVAAAKWVRSIFPFADLRVHMQPGHSAPGDSSEGEAECWLAIAPYVNGCDFQSSRKILDLGLNAVMDDPGEHYGTLGWQLFLYELWDIGRRFQHGVGGWPTRGYQGLPLTLRAKEYASWWVSRKIVPESTAIQMGNLIRTVPAFIEPKTGNRVEIHGMVEMIGDGCTVTR